MSNWHNIDDPQNPPPKDGTEILVYLGNKRIYGGNKYRVVKWFQPSNPAKAGFWSGVSGGAGLRPSHWQQLEPPDGEA